MKAITCLLFWTFIGLVSCQTQRDDEKVGEKMNLPLTYVEGLGPFHPSASLLGYEYRICFSLVCVVVVVAGGNTHHHDDNNPFAFGELWHGFHRHTSGKSAWHVG